MPFGFGDFFPSLLGSNAFGLVLFSGLMLLLLLLLRLLERDILLLLLLSFLLRVTGGDLLREGCHLGSFLSGSGGDLLRLGKGSLSQSMTQAVPSLNEVVSVFFRNCSV